MSVPTVSGMPTFFGTFKCPSDFVRFCTNSPNCNCSNNGVCANGVCVCRSGYGGVNCNPIVCHAYCEVDQCTGTADTDCNLN